MSRTQGQFDFKELIEEIDAEELLDTLGLGYRRGAGDTMMLDECPHCGRNGKANFSRTRKVGHCWHSDCGEKWNTWKLIQKTLETDNKGVAHFLQTFARRVGASAPRTPLASIMPCATGWSLPFSVELPTADDQTHPYLLNRRITLASQKRFGLRWCEDGWFNYLDDEGNRRGMFFGQRVLLPVFDLDGSLQTFQGRDVTGEAEKRYLFPVGLPGSGRFLYGGQHVRGKRSLVMNEGPIDVMATHQAIDGLPDWSDWSVIGSFGLEVGSEDAEGNDQLGRLRKLMTDGLKEVVIMWDGEVNAFRHAVKAGVKLRGIGLVVRIATLPPDADPADVDTRVIREAITNARPLTRESEITWLVANPYVGRSKK